MFSTINRWVLFEICHFLRYMPALGLVRVQQRKAGNHLNLYPT